ncbi:MAG: hypothetical protein JKX98_11955 [Alcanivoracaceae bacterium]|nr:hypothetical protein [Alcanivoracaceae bacterium]
MLPETVNSIRAITTARIIIFDPTVEFKTSLPSLINKFGKVVGLEQFVDTYEDLSRRNVSKELKLVVENLNLSYFDKFKVLCNNINKTCPIILPEGGILTWDYGHWTIETSKLFKKNLKVSYVKIAEIFQ